MNQSTWEKLEEMFAEAPMMKATPVDEAELLQSAAAAGFVLPSDYVQFVCRYGGATVGPYSVYGLRASETMGRDEASAFDVTKRFRSQGWKGLDGALVISSDHSGNPVYLAPSGEVWITDHDFGGASKLANNFEDYLLSKCLS
jgi:hypothetical protein